MEKRQLGGANPELIGALLTRFGAILPGRPGGSVG